MSEPVFLPTETLKSFGETPIDSLIRQVSEMIGFPDNPEVRQLVVDCLDRAAAEMNMGGVFLYRQTKVEFTTSDSSLTDLQRTFTLPNDWGWPQNYAACYDENGDLQHMLEWLSWEDFVRIRSPYTGGDSSDKSVPEYLAIESEAFEIIHAFPPADATKVTRLVIPYVARVQRPSEYSSIYITPEMQECLLKGGEAFAMRQEHSEDPRAWLSYWRQFLNSIAKAKGAAQRRRRVRRRFLRPRI